MVNPGDIVGSGWTVVKAIPREAHATGGNFSQGFIVDKAGRPGFMKLFDVLQVGGGPDPLRQAQAAIAAFNFERDLLEKCRSHSLSHVVVPIEDGQMQRAPFPLHYIIFEAADGDIRRVLRAKRTLDAAWLLRCMHGICVGVAQLHSIEIAHQDLKPSNVLICGEQAKIADLGRACDKQVPAPHDAAPHAGDGRYVPPELAYGYQAPDWPTRRLACDFFHIGSMLTYMINGANMTMLMFSGIVPDYHPKRFRGAYRDVAAHLRNALEDSLLILESWFHGEHGREIADMIRKFCDPEPEVRLRLVSGGRSGAPLQWHISRLDFLSHKAASGLLRIAGDGTSGS